ncbi:MAG: hypothetical protein ACKVQC_06445 [Elusimicrobiota bacterium]
MITELLNRLGASEYDLILFKYAPICSAVGCLVQQAVIAAKARIRKGDGKLDPYSEVYRPMKTFFCRLMIGTGVGFVIALLFMGTVKEGVNAISRLLAFAVIMGYSAERFWKSQEELATRAVEDKMNQILGSLGMRTREDKRTDVIDFKPPKKSSNDKSSRKAA